MDGYVPVKVGSYSGWRLEAFDLGGRWEDIRAHIAGVLPFYSTEPHRRVYRMEMDSGPRLFVKVQDEGSRERTILGVCEASMARRYLENYALISRHGIPTPVVLFSLERRGGLRMEESVLGTRELVGHESLPSYLQRRRGEPDFAGEKALLIGELARTTARLHRLGLYFSLDGRNLFVGPGGASIAILDLDHMRRGWMGRMPLRRRERNLDRLRATLRRIEGAGEEDFERFLKTYEDERK